MPFVDLVRGFRDLTEAELEAPELLVSLAEHHLIKPIGWPELLQHPRVLLLSEAGSGKTMEMREQARRIQAEHKTAFFIDLASLAREDLSGLLSAEEEREFGAWKANDSSLAWFFLDAADELKLTQGKLERALGRLAKAADGLLHRVHVVVSCRPSDWRPSLDLATVQATLPVPPARPSTPIPPDDLFLTALRRDVPKHGVKTNQITAGRPRAVVLLPLGKSQIAVLARSLGVNDVTAFVAEIHRQNAWIFAGRPLDLTELAETWKVTGRLGTRSEQHEANVRVKLKDDPSRPDRGLLSDVRSRSGAERIALALALTHTRTIRSPEQALDAERGQGVLDSAAILTDWTEEERQALLRRALFDPATYGRVRFHHRSVQEYLAARELETLRQKGMSRSALRRLLFTERDGAQVVVPSMRPIAAWLALWNDDVRRALSLREPEVLLSMGDPEGLPISARAALLRAYAEAYGQGGWRGVDVSIDEVRRLAHPELSNVIRDLWGDGPRNGEVRSLLLDFIWQGAIEQCSDIAERAVYNEGSSVWDRIVAIRALQACGRTDALKAIATSMRDDPTKWPHKIVHGTVADFFPDLLSPRDLVDIVERVNEPKDAGRGFAWTLRQVASNIEPWSQPAVELRDLLADLVWRGRQQEQDSDRFEGRFNYVAPALALLCDRQLSEQPTAFDPALIRACAIAGRFGDDETGARDIVAGLRTRFDDAVGLREGVFWQELSLVDQVAPTEGDPQRRYRTESDSLIGQLDERDRPWLERTLEDHAEPRRRSVALHALVTLWVRRGQVREELGILRHATADHSRLTDQLEAWTSPPEQNTRMQEFELNNQRRRAIEESREQQRLADWVRWRDELVAAPDAAFSPEERPRTVSNLYAWLDMRTPQRSRYNAWDAEALRDAFGDDVAKRAERAFREAWRGETPVLSSQRPEGERNTTPWAWIYGLLGLAAEAAAEGWAESLSSDEARVAATYATIELNGFPTWLTDLLAAQPAAVEAVLGGELESELAHTERSYLAVLQNVAYGDVGLKRLLAPRILVWFANWPSEFATVEDSNHSALHLETVVRILDEVTDGERRTEVAAHSQDRFLADPAGPLALSWLRSLFRFDPKRGAESLEVGCGAVAGPGQATRVIGLIGTLFGNHDNVFPAAVDPPTRADALGRLVRLTYRFVRPEDDQSHEGVYSPDARDRAQTARGFLLSALLDTPGPAARAELLDLAADPIVAGFTDRLRHLIRERTAKEAEGEPMPPADVVALEERYEAPPHDRDGLFQVMVDRLDDLTHDIVHDDFTDRRTLRTIQDESEMQRTIARRLRDMARAAYVVMREDEVADLKRTDIRLAAVRGDQKATIEIKIADQRWSLTELERALSDQLVGQYLRHEGCRAGCLLLTFDGTKKYWEHPDTGARLSFNEVIEHLAGRARSIEHDSAYSVRLVVRGIDLTDPVIVRA